MLCLKAAGAFRETHCLPTRRSAQSLAWCAHINFQPVPVLLASSCLDAFIDEVTGKANSWKLKQTLCLTRNMQHWHLRLGILACWLDVPDTLQVILCHLCPLERKNVTLMPLSILVATWGQWLTIFIFFSLTKELGKTCSNKTSLLMTHGKCYYFGCASYYLFGSLWTNRLLQG